MSWASWVNKNLHVHVQYVDGIKRGPGDREAPTLISINRLVTLRMLAGLVLIGHGGQASYIEMEPGGMDPESSRLYASEINSVLDYKLSRVYVKSCYSALGTGWPNLVSRNGRAWGAQGMVWPYDPNSLVPLVCHRERP